MTAVTPGTLGVAMLLGISLTLHAGSSLAGNRADEVDEESSPASEHDGEPSRRYTTREERRDEGTRYRLIDGLTISGLVELEYERERLEPRDSSEPETRLRNDQTSAEAVFEFTPLDWVKAEVVYEYDGELHDVLLDEALVAFEFGDFELELGKLYVPFGEYFSHFVTGPLLEFGETRGRAAVLSWNPLEEFDASLFAYRGDARKFSSAQTHLDWGFAAEWSPLEVITLGTSFISDLADSDEQLLQDSNNRYQRRTGGISGYAVLGFEQVEITAEYVRTLNRFKELDEEIDQPFAYNLEFQVYPLDVLAVAFRYEGSREFEDAPDRQMGIAAVYQVTSKIFMTVEYLEGRFRPEFAEDDFENELKTVDTFAVQLSIGL